MDAWFSWSVSHCFSSTKRSAARTNTFWLLAASLTREDAQAFLAALAVIVRPVAIHYSWRPQLRDPADEMVLETAVNGAADALVTFNLRDFAKAPARFGIELLLPSEALRRLR